MKRDGKSEMWCGAYTDCLQDDCENCPFSSIGGLQARSNPVAPKYVAPEDAAEYLAGYTQAALEMYGDDWATCSFGWKPAITIGEEK